MEYGVDPGVAPGVITQLNQLQFPALQWNASPHEPTSTEPRPDMNLPHTFTYQPALVSTEIEPILRRYLSAGISPWTLSRDGVVGSKMQHAHVASTKMVMDCEMRFTGLIYASLFAAINETLWEEAPRNTTALASRSYGLVGLGRSGKPDLDLCDPARLLCIEIKPCNTVSRQVVDALIHLVQSDLLMWRAHPGRFDRAPGGRAGPTHDLTYQRALRVLNQMYIQFVESPKIRYDVLVTPDVAVVFHWTPSSIEVSRPIERNGNVTQREMCNNFFSLLLGLAVLPKPLLIRPPPETAGRQTRSQATDLAAAGPPPRAPTRPAQPATDRSDPTRMAANASRAPARHVAATPSPVEATPPLTPSTNSSPDSKHTSSVIDVAKEASSMILDVSRASSSCDTAFAGALYESNLVHLVFRGPLSAHELTSPIPVVRDSGRTSPRHEPLVTPIVGRIGQGGVWNVFATDSGDVLKIVCVDAHVNRDDYDAEYAALKHLTMRTHIGADIKCLAALAGLACVPQLKGVWAAFASDRQYWAVMTSYAGEPVASSDREAELLPASTKQSILDAYAAIHARGIRHGDLKLEHWRTVTPNGPICLIDFTHAEDVGGMPEQEGADILFDEIGDVRGWLGELTGDWATHPYALTREGGKAAETDRSSVFPETHRSSGVPT